MHHYVSTDSKHLTIWSNVLNLIDKPLLDYQNLSRIVALPDALIELTTMESASPTITN